MEPEIREIDGINNQRGKYFCKSKGLLQRTRNESIINGEKIFVNPKVYCIEPEIWEIDGIDNQRGEYFCKLQRFIV